MNAFWRVIRRFLPRLRNRQQQPADSVATKRNPAPSPIESKWIPVPDGYSPRDDEEILEVRTLLDEKPRLYLLRNKAQD